MSQTGSNGQVLTTDGAGNFTFTTVSGGGSSYGDSDVETLFGQYDFHLLTMQMLHTILVVQKRKLDIYS